MKLSELSDYLPYQWKIQACNQYKAILVAYLTSRDVQKKLDKVCGPENWKDKYYEVAGNTYCELSIKIDGEWIGKSDCGVPSAFDKEKGQASDAFKRASVKWGVGRFLYKLDHIVIKNTVQRGNKWLPVEKAGSEKPIYNINEYVQRQGLDAVTRQATGRAHIDNHFNECETPEDCANILEKLKKLDWVVDSFREYAEQVCSNLTDGFENVENN